MYENTDDEAMNDAMNEAVDEAIKEFNKMNFFQKLAGWWNMRRWAKYFAEIPTKTVTEHMPVSSLIHAVFWMPSIEKFVEIPVFVWQVTRVNWKSTGDKMVDVKALVPFSMIDLEYESRHPESGLFESTLWETKGLADHGLFFRGYRTLDSDGMSIPTGKNEFF